jgi:hypothetical protein
MWQARLATLRDRQSSIYRDPGSLQAAQIISELNLVQMFRQPGTYAQGLGGKAEKFLVDNGKRYTKLRRRKQWLVQRAVRGLVHSEVEVGARQTAIHNLKTIALCDPKYGSAEQDPIQKVELNVFSPSSVLWDGLEHFTRDPNE